MSAEKKTPVAARHLRWDKLASERLSALLSRRYVSAEQCTVARFELKRGAIVARHQHENEQICCVLEGALKFTMDGAETIVRAGELLVIHANLPHAAEAVEDTLVLDFFTPPRRDWAAGPSDYLRG